MSTHSANDLIEACLQMRMHQPLARVCATSIKAEREIRDNVSEFYLYKDCLVLGVITKICEIEVCGFGEIETSHGFFFANWDEAQEFLAEVRKLKRSGISWDTIVYFTEGHMKGRA